MATPTIVPRVEKLECRVDDHEKRINSIEDFQIELRLYVKVISWLAVALGVNVVALVWGLLTGAVQIVR